MIRGRALFVGMNFVTSPFLWEGENRETRENNTTERGSREMRKPYNLAALVGTFLDFKDR